MPEAGRAMFSYPLQDSWRGKRNDKGRVLPRKIHTATLKDKRIDPTPANFVLHRKWRNHPRPGESAGNYSARVTCGILGLIMDCRGCNLRAADLKY